MKGRPVLGIGTYHRRRGLRHGGSHVGEFCRCHTCAFGPCVFGESSSRLRSAGISMSTTGWGWQISTLPGAGCLLSRCGQKI